MAVRKHLVLALCYFLVAALLGVLLRLFVVAPVGVPYKYLVHTHSHIALLGWVYLAITTILFGIYLNTPQNTQRYHYLFWFNQLTLIGMLVTFPIQGYALFSIIFSTLFLFASYWYFWFFLRFSPPEIKNTPAAKCIRYGLWYMSISSLGPWALGAIMNTLGPTSIWYRLAIYFYLHFQYNGWMIMALLGLLFYIMHKAGHPISKPTFQRILWSANFGIILSFFLSTLWIKPHWSFNILGAIGALSQLIAFFWTLQWLFKVKGQKSRTRRPSFLGKILLVVLLMKLGLQLASAHPDVAQLAATALDFTIGYLHLVFLGVITIGIFMVVRHLGWLRLSSFAIGFYLLGFLLTEVLIFYRGFAAWLGLGVPPKYAELLIAASGSIVVGVVGIVFDNSILKQSKIQN
ncbi:MAG: hypothetical protein AAF717_05635 [Bacteroidota bacterium]